MYQKNRGKVIKPVLEKLIFVRVNKCEKVKSEFGFKLEREEKIKKNIYTAIRNQQPFILAAFTKITVHMVQVSTYKI